MQHIFFIHSSVGHLNCFHILATMENSMEVHEKLKLELPYALAIPLVGIYPKENHNSNICMSSAGLVAIAESCFKFPSDHGPPLTINQMQEKQL